jgi:multiple sugar transport system ATP-binding protein
MAEVRLQNVWKVYGGTVEAVKGVNLVCHDKEFLCLLGPSGCGKSSTLRMIAGLESVTQGEVFIGGRNVTHVPPKDRDIAMVFENYALYPHLTVYDNIAMPLKVRGFSKAEIDAKVRHAAKILHMTDLLDRRTVRLSGGQKQRVGIGRAIVRNPAVFLMDEPISHLEAQLRAQMRVELKRLHLEVEATTVYVTHDQLEAMALADRIAVMNFGVLQQVGTPTELFDKPANQFVAGFIGSPPMNFLSCELVREGDEMFVQGQGYKVALPAETKQKLLLRGKDGSLILGIRPLDVRIAQSADEATPIAAQTFVYEPQGETCQVTVQLDGQLLSVETSGDFFTQAGETAWIGFDTAKLHLFDSKTGVNLVV